MAICCRLTSTLNIIECSISININTATEIIKECTDNNGNTTEVLTGATTGTLSLNAYTGQDVIHTDCAESASLSVPWIRKYDCENDITYFINGGNGTSTMVGSPALVSIGTVVHTTKTLQASASGPASMYSITDQINGYGLTYTGGPLTVDSNSLTRELSDIVLDNQLISELGLTPETTLYLQNFNLTNTPGELPTVNYSFTFGV